MLGAEILDSIGGDIDKCYQNVRKPSQNTYFSNFINVLWSHFRLYRKIGMHYNSVAVLEMLKLQRL